MTDVVPKPIWAAAFAAGKTCVLSPCVLPLTPSYPATARELFELDGRGYSD